MSPVASRWCRIGAGAWTLAALTAGCSFSPSGDPGVEVDAGRDDAGNRIVVVRDDSLEHFAVVGAVRDGLVIEPWGALAPAAYHAGGLIAYAANTQRFTEADAATWTAVTSGPPAGTGVWVRPLVGDPVGVGLDSGDTWTYWAEGEVWLDAGATTFVVDADDTGFVELAAPGGAFTRVVNARFGVGTGTFTAATEGWHPIRLAVVEGIGASRFDVQLYPGTSTTPVPLAGPRLRARVEHLRGTVLAGWDHTVFQGLPERTISTAPLVDANFGSGAPQGLGIGPGDYWSLRWSGQFYAIAAGTYRVRVESDDGHRLYVNGERVSDEFYSGPQDRSVDVELVAGWNDLVLDHNENNGNARMRLRVTGGPEPGLTGELPASRLRPLEPRRRRLETGFDPIDYPVPDNGEAEAKVELGGLPGATVREVEVIVTVNHNRIADLELRLIHPGGNIALLRDNSDSGGNGTRALRYTPTEFADLPAAGTWTVRVTDNVTGNTGTLQDVQLAVHLAGGPEQVARTAAYTSLVRDLGDGVTALDAVRFGARVPPDGGVAVRVRTCAAAAECLAEPWSAPLTDGSGATPPGVEPRRYLQYRVELTSDGEREPELEWLEVEYRVPAAD